MTKLQEYWRDLPSHKKQALADQVGMKKGSLSNVFNGTVNPSLDLIKRLIKETNKKVKFAWFLEDK